MTKKMIRREINSCFIPKCYFTRGITKKDFFKQDLLRAINKIKESEKRCA